MSVITLNPQPGGADEASGQALSDAETYGPPELCAWQVAPGVFWIQTTEPRFSRKLEKRQDARPVEMSGVNHYRRTYEIRGRRRKIERIIDRFLMSAGGHFWADVRPENAPNRGGSINIAARPNRYGKIRLLKGDTES
ncbi:MAG: hypothetical protein ACREFF_08865 [Candidatus Udaeobacter sp.]